MRLWYKNTTKSFVTVLRKSRPYKAPVAWGTTSVPGLAGVILNQKTVHPIVIPVRILVEGDTQDQYRQNAEEVAAWLDSTKAEPLMFEDENRTYYAVLDGSLDPEEIVSFGFVDVNFLCPDSYKYGDKQIDSFTGEMTILNRATAFAPPVIDVYFTQDKTNYVISLDGKDFRLIRNFTAGDRVVIDCVKQVVKLNGEIAMPIRDWRTPFKNLFLRPGENTFVAESGAEIESTFTERYGNII